MMVKVDNDRIGPFMHVSYPILQFSYHITTFPYLLINSIIHLNFSNPLIIVNMEFLYTLFLYDFVLGQFSKFLLHSTTEDDLSYCRGSAGDPHNFLTYVSAYHSEELMTWE